MIGQDETSNKQNTYLNAALINGWQHRNSTFGDIWRLVYQKGFLTVVFHIYMATLSLHNSVSSFSVLANQHITRFFIYIATFAVFGIAVSCTNCSKKLVLSVHCYLASQTGIINDSILVYFANNFII